ncbi:MAG: alpha/beta hydrolase [Gammaproteobacteria bacterium]
MDSHHFQPHPTGPNLAVSAQSGSLNHPGIFWLGGFMSNMRGTKAEALAAWAAEQNRACVRFDYSGHGESLGEFNDGTIGQWLAESLAVFNQYCRSPQVIIGSSMGGWLALLLIRALMQQSSPLVKHIKGLVLIAPAVDFTEKLIWEQLTPDIQTEFQATGSWSPPQEHGSHDYLFTYSLIEEGRQHLLLSQPIATPCPVRILQGVLDTDVPWQHSTNLLHRLTEPDVVLTLVKDGDHSLSRPQDISQLIQFIESF